MRVLHIHGYDHGGGAETVFNITRRNPLVEENYSGYIKEDMTDPGYSDVKFRIYSEFPFPMDILSYFFSMNNYNALNRFLTGKKIDVVHLHSFIGALSPSILLPLKEYRKKNNIKIVQTVHEFNLVCPNSVLFNYKQNAICEKCLSRKIKTPIITSGCDRRGNTYSFLKGIRSIISNNIIGHKDLLDAIIAPSELMKQKLIEGGIDGNKITIVRNPIDEIKEEELRSKENIICYFGRFSKEKNAGFILESFIKWKSEVKNDFVLLLIGGGDEEAMLKEKASQSPFAKDIVFKPFMPQAQLKTYLGNVKYFTMASKCYETAPMGILEAATFNILSVVPNLGGMKETVEKIIKAGIIYNSDDSTSWCEAINRLEASYNDELNKLLMQKNRFKSEFGIDSYYRNIYSVYGGGL